MKNPRKGIAFICKEENAANNKSMEQRMVAHGGENPTRKANARRHVAHATVRGH